MFIYRRDDYKFEREYGERQKALEGWNNVNTVVMYEILKQIPSNKKQSKSSLLAMKNKLQHMNC